MQLSYGQLSYHVHSTGFNLQLKKERKIILQYPKQRVRVSYNSIVSACPVKNLSSVPQEENAGPVKGNSPQECQCLSRTQGSSKMNKYI